MADGKIEVELKLLTEKAKQQLKEFAKNMPADLTGGQGGGGGGKDAGAAEEKHVKKLEKVRDKLKEIKQAGLDAWRASIPPMQIIDTTARAGLNLSTFADRVKLLRQKMFQRGDLTAADALKMRLGTPTGENLSNPQQGLATTPSLESKGPVKTVPQQGLATTPSLESKGPVKTVGAQPGSVNALLNKPMSPLVQLGAGLAALRVAVGLVSWGFNLAIAPLKAFNRIITEAAESARRLYAKSLSSGGMPIGFTAHRSNLARVLGVGEQEVFQYGKQVAYLNDKLRMASGIQAKYTLGLTETAWKQDVLKANWSSFMTSLADDFKPFKDELLDFINKGVLALNKAREESKKEQERLTFLAQYAKEHGLETRGFKSQQPWGYEVDASDVIARPVSGEGAYLVNKAGKRDEEAMKAWEAEWAKRQGPIPGPETSARRYATSSWERMGLVVGGIGADSASKQTAQNTRKTVELLNAILSRFMVIPSLNPYFKPEGAQEP